jgi:hypothetical protein
VGALKGAHKKIMKWIEEDDGEDDERIGGFHGTLLERHVLI